MSSGHALLRLPPRAVLDGAMGTELIARGLRLGEDCPESWNDEHPDEVRAVYQAYFAAGCDAVQTNTFGGSRLRLGAYGRSAMVRTLNVAAGLLAREARPTHGFVIGVVGPTGSIPPPEGNADLIELEDCFAEQAAALAEGGVDLVHVETMYHPKEARAAVRGIRAGAPGLPIVGSMTCRLSGGSYLTPLGFAPERMLAAFLEEEVDGVGANCTLSPVDMVELVRAIRARTDRPIFAKPTAAPSGRSVLMPEDLGSGARALFAAGATAVGGCCGAGPAHLAAIRSAADAEGR